MHPIFADKKSGKNAGREDLWQALNFLRDGDSLVVPSLDRFGPFSPRPHRHRVRPAQAWSRFHLAAHSGGQPTAARTGTRLRPPPHHPGEDRTREKRCPPDRSRRPPPPRTGPAARPGRQRSAIARPRYLHAQEESRPGRDRRAKPAREHRERAAPHADERCRRSLRGSCSARRRPSSRRPARSAR
ncbi:recombinase family protein [Streptomyces sp. NPDC055749]